MFFFVFVNYYIKACHFSVCCSNLSLSIAITFSISILLYKNFLKPWKLGIFFAYLFLKIKCFALKMIKLTNCSLFWPFCCPKQISLYFISMPISNSAKNVFNCDQKCCECWHSQNKCATVSILLLQKSQRFEFDILHNELVLKIS